MNGAEEGPSFPTEGQAHVSLAWLSWLLMLVGSGLVAVYMLILIAFLAIGGMELVAGVWAGNVKNDPMYTWVIIASLILGFPPGAFLGVRLWARLMRRTGWIGAERIKRMSGF